jgi:hypothetical protein
MAINDCGFCADLYNCAARISNDLDFYTFAAKMLCEIAENTGGSGPIENQNIASVGGVPVTIEDFQEGNVAHDAPDSGNPLKIGFRARTSDITAVANDDRTDGIADKIGRQVVAPYALPEEEAKGTTGDIVDTTSTQVIAAVASQKLYITSITVSNMSDTVMTRVDIQDGSGGTVIWQGPAAMNGGGFTQEFPMPISTTAGNGLFAVCGTTGALVRVSAAGYSGV